MHTFRNLREHGFVILFLLYCIIFLSSTLITKVYHRLREIKHAWYSQIQHHATTFDNSTLTRKTGYFITIYNSDGQVL